ncbi:MAG TPA: GntR family transcriptional regulator [Thermoanaerobaculia bacterium]|jgi:GntR family transcriptional regulator|nr:GntR family transcriptional regulator [Thermoanaerobaculia bacterium]
MELLLNLSELSAEPLHAQISRQIRARLLARDLAGDEALPSIRALAREQRVSVITVQRAYEDLEREGLIRSRPGKGFFVAAIPRERKQDMAERRFEAALARLLAESAAEGLDEAQIREVFERLLRARSIQQEGGR